MVIRYGKNVDSKMETVLCTPEMIHVIVEVGDCMDLGIQLDNNRYFAGAAGQYQAAFHNIDYPGVRDNQGQVSFRGEH